MTWLLIAGGVAWVVFLIGLFSRCNHRHVTFPQRTQGEPASHVTCLSCGKEIPYTVLDPERDL